MESRAASQPTVYVERSDRLTAEGLGAALAALGHEGRIRRSKTILVKLNLAAGLKKTPDTGTNVGPEQLAPLLDALVAEQEEGQVLIGDSDSTDEQLAPEKFACLGYNEDYLRRWRGRVVLADLTRLPPACYEPPAQRHFRSVVLPRVVVECDYLVSCACIKTHNFARLTGAVKNMFGCLPEMDKHRHHPSLARVLVDLMSVRRPDLAVLLGNPGQVGNGPVHGVPTFFGLNLIGDDAAATDAVEAVVLGVHPRRVAHLLAVAREGLGTISLEDIRLVGASLEELAQRCLFIGSWARAVLWLALRVQGVGESVSMLGHQMHRVHRPGQLLLVYRPVIRWVRRRLGRRPSTEKAQPR